MKKAEKPSELMRWKTKQFWKMEFPHDGYCSKGVQRAEDYFRKIYSGGKQTD